jgi:hypothetical protein
MEFKTIPTFDCVGIPSEVDDYIMDNHGISTHHQNDIIFIENDGNPLAEWLKKNGHVFKEKDGDWLGMWAT